MAKDGMDEESESQPADEHVRPSVAVYRALDWNGREHKIVVGLWQTANGRNWFARLGADESHKLSAMHCFETPGLALADAVHSIGGASEVLPWEWKTRSQLEAELAKMVSLADRLEELLSFSKSICVFRDDAYETEEKDDG